MNIPFVDLKAQYDSIKSEIDVAIERVLTETSFIKGKYVTEFEQNFANKCGINYCVSCANGTDAIYIALKTLGVGPGDEVITVANSWISTSETISQAGAKPIFVDINKHNYNIDVSQIENTDQSEIENLKVHKNQLEIEKNNLEEKYRSLAEELEIAQEKIKKLESSKKKDLKKQNEFNQKIDELNQETEYLIEEIDKWEM